VWIPTKCHCYQDRFLCPGRKASETTGLDGGLVVGIAFRCFLHGRRSIVSIAVGICTSFEFGGVTQNWVREEFRGNLAAFEQLFEYIEELLSRNLTVMRAIL
jgi:hypothetical protein